MADLLPAGKWKLFLKGSERVGQVGNLSVDFRTNTGTLEYQHQTTQLTQIERHGNEFTAHYSAGRFQGRLVATTRDGVSRIIDIHFIGSGGTPDAQLSGIPVDDKLDNEVATSFKGTYDLAGAAVALMNAKLGIEWSNEGSDFTSAHSFAEMLKVRRMCCFEFVHFAAYLAGKQRVAASGNPMVSGAAATVFNTLKYTVWDRKTIIPKGKVVEGVARAFNNQSGFYHVGISLGDGRIISLSGGTGIHIENVSSLFSSFLYSEVRVADYNWAVAQGDHSAPPLPPLFQPK